MNKFSKTKYITGFKALGVIMIVLAHLHYEFSALPDLAYKLVAFSGYFVVIFFVVSAYTICMSLDRMKSFNFMQYMKRRWLRLASLYYVMIVIGLFAKTAINHWAFAADTIKDLFLHFTFLNLNLIYEPSQSSYLGFEWMIPILFWFYVLIPVFLYLARKKFYLFIPLLLCAIYLHFHLDALVAYKGIMGGYHAIQEWVFIYVYVVLIYNLTRSKITLTGVISLLLPLFLLLTQLQTNSERVYAVILIGITVYLLLLKKRIILSLPIMWIRFIVDNAEVVLLIALAGKYMLNLYYLKNPQMIMTLWSVCLLLAARDRQWLIRLFFENRVMQFIGVISFALYLDHNLAISLIGYLIAPQYAVVRIISIVGVAIIGAFLLHRYIEVPLLRVFARHETRE